MVRCETRRKASLNCGELVVVVREVWLLGVSGGSGSNVRWCGVNGPRQSFDDGVAGVDHPATCFCVADCAMLLL